MAQQKRPTAQKKRRTSVRSGDGLSDKMKRMIISHKLRSVLAVVFVISFVTIGVYLLRNGFADDGTTITVASWNAKIDNNNNIAKEVKTILGKSNVVGLQEVHTATQRDNIQKLIQSNAYAVSPKAHTNNDSKAGVESYAIVWRQKEFTRVKEGTVGPVAQDVDGLRPRFITWVKLRQNATAKQFYVVNTHMVKDVELNGQLNTAKNRQDNVAAYAGHMQKLVELVARLKKDNMPIFVTGDFAVNYRKDTGKVATFPRAALGALGVKSNWQLTNMKGIATDAKTFGASTRLIDYVFTWKAQPMSTSIGSSSHGSDHYPVYFRADLASPTGTTNL